MPQKFGKPGPFPVIEIDGSGTVESPISPPRRDYTCPNYSTCLELACALNWDSFTCRGCSKDIDSTLVWQAQSSKRKDQVAQQLCEGMPTIQCHESNQDALETTLKIAK
ncbi:MAG: hypothetical protein R3A13_04995 [Bdellovibrionota bacterium]